MISQTFEYSIGVLEGTRETFHKVKDRVQPVGQNLPELEEIHI